MLTAILESHTLSYSLSFGPLLFNKSLGEQGTGRALPFPDFERKELSKLCTYLLDCGSRKWHPLERPLVKPFFMDRAVQKHSGHHSSFNHLSHRTLPGYCTCQCRLPISSASQGKVMSGDENWH